MQNKKIELACPCGSYCGECDYHQKKCGGCHEVKGKPFWGECRFYACARKKNIEHCGFCEELPCDYFLSTYDPKEGQSSVFNRVGQLVYRKKIGTNAWVEKKTKDSGSG